VAWRCETCGETVSDDEFQVCWNCGAARSETRRSDSSSVSVPVPAPVPLPPPLPETDPAHARLCPSCHTELQLRGTVPIRLADEDGDGEPFPRGWEREGKPWGLEAWTCRLCRRVLLYEVRR
jgi:hypothetical protein